MGTFIHCGFPPFSSLGHRAFLVYDQATASITSDFTPIQSFNIYPNLDSILIFVLKRIAAIKHYLVIFERLEQNIARRQSDGSSGEKYKRNQLGMEYK